MQTSAFVQALLIALSLRWGKAVALCYQGNINPRPSEGFAGQLEICSGRSQGTVLQC